MITNKLMTMAAVALCAGAASAQRTISENVSLEADADWSADGTITINAGATVDLAGHSLKVSGLVGEGSIVSTTENFLPNASFENFTVTPSGSNGDLSELLSWTYVPNDVASAGFCKSKDGTWSDNLASKDGAYSVWFWCKNNSSGGAMVSNTVNIAEAGQYRLSFWTAARPGSAWFLDMRVHADVDGISRGYAVCSETSWKETAILLELSAGEHTIAFRSDGTGGGRNPCGLLDMVSLKRTVSLRLAHAAGATYSCQSLMLGPSVVPTAETQTLTGDIDWRGLGTVTVADGVTLDLDGHTLYTDGLVYDKSASDGLGVDLITNGNLEEVDGNPSGGRVQISEDVHFTSWDWSQTQGTSHIMWVINSSSAANWCSSSPDGNYYLGWWINANNAPSSISQSINVPADGTYRLSFLAAARPGGPVYLNMYVHADIDGASQGYVALPSTTWSEKAIDLRLTAGEHVIALRGIKGSDSGSNPGGGIDKISLMRVRDASTCVTNSSETLSELHMNIASGTLRNDLLPIGGNLKLVKEGPGTYVSGMVQTYAGGTLVAGGTAQPPDGTGANATYSGTKCRVFGTGAITVAEGAVFDLRGNYDYNYIALDGGTLRNSVKMTQTGWDGASLAALTKDSHIDVQRDIVFGFGNDVVDLNGKTLFVNAARGSVLHVKCQRVGNGTVSSSGDGWLVLSGCDMSGARLEVASSFTAMGNVEVLDYTSSYSLSNYDGANGNSGDGVLGIAGTFKPLTDYWHGCELHDGATIDLSDRSSELSATSPYSRGATNLAFTADARVSVKLGARHVRSGERIIGWTEATKPANVGTVKFVRGDVDRPYGLVVKDDGLYIAKGLMILVR